MKILYLGYAVSLEEADCLSGASVAGNKMQVNILRELGTYEDVELQCITVYPLAAWPREKRLRISGKEIPVTDSVQTYRVPFWNFPVIKQIWQTFAVYKAAKRLVTKDTIILTFNLFPQVGIPLMWLKKWHGCETCSILADLPIDPEAASRKGIKKWLRSRFDKLTVRAIEYCDHFIVLNKNAISSYTCSQDYIVVEGGIPTEQVVPVTPPAKKEKKTIVYSGALSEYSGILRLIEAMSMVNDAEATLEIYGDGYLTARIRSQAEQLPNVRYMGKVSNREMLEIQRKAFLLVNPRPIGDTISKLTFPSKLFEYLLSGTPVLTTKLDGITDDYLEHLFYTEDDSPRGLAEKINEILNVEPDVLKEKSVGAQRFVTEHKTWEKQCQKIYTFLREINR